MKNQNISLIVFTFAAVIVCYSFCFSTTTIKPLSWEERLRTEAYDQNQFTEIIQQAYRTKPHVKSVRIERPLVLNVEFDNEFSGTCFLKNLWTELNHDPSTRIIQVKQFIEAYERIEDSEKNDIETLIPLIKDDKSIAEMDKNSKQAAADSTVYREPFIADLWIVYAFDSSNAMRMALESEIQKFKIEKKAMQKKAIENIAKRMTAPKGADEGPIQRIVCGGNYEASLLLFESIWPQLEKQVRGRLLVCAPSRDILYFTGTEVPNGVASMREKSKEISRKGGHLISQTILEWKDGKWIPFTE